MWVVRGNPRRIIWEGTDSEKIKGSYKSTTCHYVANTASADVAPARTRGDELQTLTINTASANITITRKRRTVDKLAVDTAKAIHTIFSE